MKKLVLTILAVSALAFTTQAQTEAGKWLVGGSVGFNSSKADGASKSDTKFEILPSAGYFVAENIAIGTAIGYSSEKTYGPVVSLQSNAFQVSPFVRGYKGVNDQFKFFGQLSVPLAFGNVKAGNANGDNMTKVGNLNGVGVALSPGVAFFPSKKIGIELSVDGIKYNDLKGEDANGNKVSGNKDFSIGADFFAPHLGVQFYF